MLCPSCNAPNRDDAKFCKKCGQSFRIEATKVSEAAVVSQLTAPSQENAATEDPTMASTQIISPQQMVEFHNRRWQQELEREQANSQSTTKQDQAASNQADLQSANSAPTSTPFANEPTRDIADMPTVLFDPYTNPGPVPIPPPPPVSSAEGAVAQSPADAGESTSIPPAPPASEMAPQSVAVPETATPAAPDAPDVLDAPDEAMEAPMATAANGHVAPTSAGEASSEHTASAIEKENDGVTQTPSDQPDENHNTPSSDFPALTVGSILHGRYEIAQLVSENEDEHVYNVIDHQGYQHCWNCRSEQNSEGDEFCIDCGAELLNATYTMHEYHAAKSGATDANTFQGTIVNTFIEQGHTYAIEQIQATANAFPNGVHLVAASDSDAGDVRRSEPNEDSTLVLMIQRVHESQAVPMGVFIVADGLGGHDNGQEASRLAINTIAERMVRELLAVPLTSEKAGESVAKADEDSLVTLLQGTIEDANAAICQINQRDKTDMGSTITGFMVVGDYAYILNVGDSRTYMLRGGQIYQLTNDHSLVGQLVAGGLIQPDDVYTHPQRSQIFRSLGDKLNVQIDIFKQQLHPGDTLLSCSDGLWEMVRNPQLESILQNAPDPQTACTQLLEAANTNGGEDNVSAVVVFVH